MQLQILDAYDRDFSKHAPISEVPRIRMVWKSIHGQLTKENKKFIYGMIKVGTRANMRHPTIHPKNKNRDLNFYNL